MSSSASKPCVRQPDQGRVLRAFGEEIHLALTGGQTGGRYAMWTEITPRGGGPPLHVHHREDEWFHVLEGRVDFLVEGQWNTVAAGGSAFMPKGVPHAFRNAGEGALKMLIQTSPAGFEVFFARCAAEFAREGGPDMARIFAISSEHGIEFLDAAGP